MRGIGIALFLLLAAAGPDTAPPPPAAPGSWTLQTSGVTTSLNGIAFANSTEGLAVGAGGVIRRTLDGTAWTGQTSGTTANLNGVGLGSVDAASAVGDSGTIVNAQNASNGAGSTWVSATTGDLSAVSGSNATHAWTAGVPGALRLTTDGTNWPLGNPGSSSITARGMSFLTTPTEGYWVGDMGTVMKTTDGTTWSPTGPSGTTNTLRSISMVAADLPGNATGWLVGDMGILRKTTDSGTMWNVVPPSGPQNLNGVYAGDDMHAWAVGDMATILATSDGNTWTPQANPLAATTLLAVSFFNSGGMWKGVAVGSGGGVAWSNNGGMTWNPGTSGTGTTLRGVAMLGDMNAIAIGDGGVVIQTTNGGGTWTPVAGIPTSENLLCVSFGSSTTGWAAGSKGTLLKSTTGGTSWTLQVGSTTNKLNDVKYGSSDVAIAVGASATILRSTNKGVQWVPLQSTDAAWAGRNLNAIAFGTTDRAVAVGPTGGILVTNNQGTSWTTVTPTTSVLAELFSVASVTPTFFVAVGGAAFGAVVGISYDTTAGTWTATPISSPPSIVLKGVAFAPYSRQGYGVADGGQIQVTRDAGSTWTSEGSGSTNNIKGVTFPNFGLGYAVTSGGEILVRRSPAPPLLSFPPHIGTPYTWEAPIIDGFINPELSELRRPDTGWNQCLQVTYADGTNQPPCTFQGLRHNSGGSLYLSFEVKADTSFDDNDTVVLLLRGDNPSPRPEHAANDRRIIINPVSTSTNGVVGGSVVAEGYTPPSSTNNENAAPRVLQSYRWDTGTNAWATIPSSTQIDCKVRAWTTTSGTKSWSLEIKIPTSNATYTDWINIGTDFLFSYYVLRVQTGGVTESSWPRDLALSGPLDVVAAPMSAFDWGTAKLGTADDGVGVRITPISYQHIGVTTPSTPPGTLETSIHGTLENTFHVFVQNTALTDALTVQPTFRIADWGVQTGDPLSGAWHLVPANNSTVNPPAAATVPAMVGTTPGEHEYTIKWQITDPAVRAEYAAHDHQCILVTLDSTSDVNFTERSSWTNMEYVPASVFKRKAWVSSKGYGLEGARNGAQHFFLHTTSDRFDYEPGKVPLDVVPAPNPKRDGQSQNNKGPHPYYSGENLQRVRLLQQFPGLAQERTAVSHYTWAIHAVKQTSRTVTIHGHVYPLLEQANGFGYIARHGSGVDQWTSGLNGAIVKKLNDSEYEVTLPVNDSESLDSGLEATEGGTTFGGMLGLILLIFLFLLIIFWFLKKQP